MLFIVRALSKTRQRRLSGEEDKGRGGEGRGCGEGEEPHQCGEERQSVGQTLHTLTCQGHSTEQVGGGKGVNKKLHLPY